MTSCINYKNAKMVIWKCYFWNMHPLQILYTDTHVYLTHYSISWELKNTTYNCRVQAFPLGKKNNQEKYNKFILSAMKLPDSNSAFCLSSILLIKWYRHAIYFQVFVCTPISIVNLCHQMYFCSINFFVFSGPPGTHWNWTHFAAIFFLRLGSVFVFSLETTNWTL